MATEHDLSAGVFKETGAPTLVSVNDPDLLTPNKYNPRDGKKGVEDVVVSLREHGYRPYEDTATGKTSHMLGFRDSEHPEKIILLRGHRRAGALQQMKRADADADKVAKRPSNHKPLSEIMREAANKWEMDTPGIPVLVLESEPTQKQQVELILDEDTSQVKKSSRQQLTLWENLIKQGYSSEDACRMLGYNARLMAFHHATAVHVPSKVRESWVNGTGGKDSEHPRMTDKDLREIHDAYKAAINDDDADKDAGEKAYKAWLERATKGTAAKSRPATVKAMKELLNFLSRYDLPDYFWKFAEFALGERRISSKVWQGVNQQTIELELRELLNNVPQREDASESSDEVQADSDAA